MSTLFTFIYTAFKSDQKYHPEFNGSIKQNFPKIFSSESLFGIFQILL